MVYASHPGRQQSQQFTMPCPMLKNLLKTESLQQQSPPSQQHPTDSDEMMRLVRMRQELAVQVEMAAAATAAKTTAAPKKPRSRPTGNTTGDETKPAKQKRASKASKTGVSQSSVNRYG